MTPALVAAWMHRVRRRLEAEDADIELYHLERLSDEEVVLMARLERRGGLQ